MRDAYMYGVIPYDLSNRYNSYTGQETPNYIWSYNSVTSRYDSTYSAYYDPTNLIRQPSKTNEYTRNFTLQADLAMKYMLGEVTTTTVTGFAMDHSTDNTQWFGAPQLPAFNLYSPVYGADAIWSYAGGQNSNTSSNQEYINEQLGFFKDRLTVTAALVRIAAKSSTNGVDSQSASKTVSQYGVMGKPVKDVTIYASRSQNSNPNSTNNTTIWQDGLQYEFGAKASFFKDRLSITAAHFNIKQTNVAVANPRYQSDHTQPQSLISDIKEHGYEFELMGGITKDFSVMASFTSLHQRDSLGRYVIMVPDRTAGLLANYRFSNGTLKGLSVFLGTNYVSRRSGEIPQINYTQLGVICQPSFFLPELQLWNLGANYTWGKVSFALNVDNLFDKEYIGLSSGRFLGGVGTPRNIRFTTSLKF